MNLKSQDYMKMRCRTTDVKTNFKSKYESFECEACKIEEETQKHIIECSEINKGKKEYEKLPDYEELYKRNVRNQVLIVRHFLENIKMRKKVKN